MPDEYALPKVLWVFWMNENNDITDSRLRWLEKMTKYSGLPVTLVTLETLPRWVLSDAPLHPAFQYLSAVHKADYLRTYFMHHYGGAYCDMKPLDSCWTEAYDELKASEAWMIGYRERKQGHVVEHAQYAWQRVLGNCAYICKARTPFTEAWYSRMIGVMDKHQRELIKHPALHPRAMKSDGAGYALEWAELLGYIFHPACIEFEQHLIGGLPPPRFQNYM